MLRSRLNHLQLPPCKTLEEPEDGPESELVPPTTQEEIEVINAIQNLANTVIANAASRLLAKYVDVDEKPMDY